MLKAKWLSDHNEDVSFLHQYDSDPADPTKKKVRVNRSKSPITFGLTYLASKLLEDKNSGLEKPCSDNLLALVEVRDNSAHFLNKDLYFGRRIQEIGTASLSNFLALITEWFQIDLSRYNFFLMPLSFYHGFETAATASVSCYSEQMQRLIAYLDTLDHSQPEHTPEAANQDFAIHLETRLVRGKDAQALEFRWTDDPSAPGVALREEDVRKAYPWTYRILTGTLKNRYADFLENNVYHEMRRQLEQDKKLVLTRSLDPSNPASSKQRFYSPNIVNEFDKHYQRRAKP